MLGIIITERNEGEEVLNTIKSIEETVEGEVEILVIDDNSDDKCEYSNVIRTDKRIGVAEARNLGVLNISTENFILLDGHMRFYDKGWNVRLEKLLNEHPKSIICSRPAIINRDENGNLIYEKGENRSPACGAYLDENFAYKWSYPIIKEELLEIPVVMGAAYASNKTWWNEIDGLKGLRLWGCDEQFMCIKTYLRGGNCYCLTDWYTGHIYRVLHINPVSNLEVLRNELFIARFVLQDENLFLYYLNNLQKRVGKQICDLVDLYNETREESAELIDSFYSKPTESLERFSNFDADVVRLNEYPTVSVLIPVYNGEKFISECINSILTSTYSHYEIVVVDDGSTDNTENIIKNFKEVKYYKKEHTGIADTLNFGLSKCTGEYIARIDADDLMLTNRLEIQVLHMLKNQNTIVLGAGMRCFNKNGLSFSYIPEASFCRFEDFIHHGNLIAHPSVMMRNIPQLRYSTKYSCEDYELWIRLAKSGYIILNIPDIVTLYRMHENQLSVINCDMFKKDIEKINSLI